MAGLGGRASSTGRPEDEEMTAAVAVVYGLACIPASVIACSQLCVLPGAVTSNAAAGARWMKGADVLVGGKEPLGTDAAAGADALPLSLTSRSGCSQEMWYLALMA